MNGNKRTKRPCCGNTTPDESHKKHKIVCDGRNVTQAGSFKKSIEEFEQGITSCKNSKYGIDPLMEKTIKLEQRFANAEVYVQALLLHIQNFVNTHNIPINTSIKPECISDNNLSPGGKDMDQRSQILNFMTNAITDLYIQVQSYAKNNGIEFKI